MKTYFVVRDTDHPAEDLERNWSAPMGGFSDEFCGGGNSNEECRSSWEKSTEMTCPYEYRYHPAYKKFVEVHFEGLGAFYLEAETLEAAIEEACEMDDDLACTTEKGDGHFYAHQVVSYHLARKGTSFHNDRYVFEIKYEA